MDIAMIADAAASKPKSSDSESIKKENVAVKFEKIFARRLVSQMTKDSFKMGDNSSLIGSNKLYRKHIVDALASEIAEQRTLGMADLISKYKIK